MTRHGSAEVVGALSFSGARVHAVTEGSTAAWCGARIGSTMLPATVTCKTCARELRRWGIAQPLVREG